MKKKMERISGELFRPLSLAEQKLITGSTTTTASTIYETANPSPDYSRDGDRD
jgi:hypothetical protein